MTKSKEFTLLCKLRLRLKLIPIVSLSLIGYSSSFGQDEFVFNEQELSSNENEIHLVYAQPLFAMDKVIGHEIKTVQAKQLEIAPQVKPAMIRDHFVFPVLGAQYAVETKNFKVPGAILIGFHIGVVDSLDTGIIEKIFVDHHLVSMFKLEYRHGRNYRDVRVGYQRSSIGRVLIMGIGLGYGVSGVLQFIPDHEQSNSLELNDSLRYGLNIQGTLIFPLPTTMFYGGVNILRGNRTRHVSFNPEIGFKVFLTGQYR